MAKIGVMGGTFNPIHMGHIEMASAAKKHLDLERVLFMTGGNPPHKAKRDITDADLRHEMVKRAVEGMEGFEACDYEVKKDGFSYTSETLAYLKKTNIENELYFILGGDSLDYIDKWHCPEEIFALATIVVFDRSGYDSRHRADELLARFHGRIIYIDEEIITVSSRKIRALCDMGLDISGLVPLEVRRIIEKQGLYRGRIYDMRKKVRRRLEPRRLAHTMGVAELSVRMAEIFGEDIEKAYIAGLLHDCAKNIPKEEMYRLCEENNVVLDEFERTHPALVHAKLGAYLAQRDYGVTDEDIINAVRWHTLGRKSMTKLEKIIFVADMAEPGRDFPDISELRSTALCELDRAVYLCLERTIAYNTAKGVDIHPSAYELKEYFKELLKGGI